MRNVIFAVPAMAYFAELARDVLGWELMLGAPVGDCDTCLIIGMYDPPDYDFTLRCTHRAKKRIIHWCGTDVLMLQDASLLPDAIHIADHQGLADELAAKGVDASEVMWPTKHHFEVTPLPKKPKIACYVGSDPVRYGAQIFSAIEEAMPEYDFIAYPFGAYDAEQMRELVADCSIYLRLTAHDGSAASAREFMEAGRRAITTNGIPYATRVNRHDITGIIAAIRKAAKETEPDYEAAAYWHAQNSVERYKGEFDGIA